MVMSALVPIGAALVLGFVAWKVLKGLIKLAAFACIVIVLGVLHWQGAY
jgi:hypothetical protein